MAAQQNGGNAVPDFTVKAGLAQMLKGGVIMDVVNAEQVSSFFFSSGKQCIDVYRPASLKKPVPQPLWPSSESPPISESKVALLVCLIPP